VYSSNGPALHVLLIDGKSPEAGKDFAIGAIKNVDLGDLKGNQGDQDYRLPNGVNLQELNTVVDLLHALSRELWHRAA